MDFYKQGLYLESLINYTIEFYRGQRKALIFKDVIHGHFGNRKNLYFQKGTVDYTGVYQGHYICFEAKTTIKDYLPWRNILPHQWNFMVQAKNFGAISFLIVYFVSRNEYYLIFIKDLIYLKNKNITLTWKILLDYGHELKSTLPIGLNFLPTIIKKLSFH